MIRLTSLKFALVSKESESPPAHTTNTNKTLQIATLLSFFGHFKKTTETYSHCRHLIKASSYQSVMSAGIFILSHHDISF